MVSTSLSQQQQAKLIGNLGMFKIQGEDKGGRPILHIIGKLFPANLVSVDAVKTYLEEEIYPSLSRRPFSVVYVNTGVESFPGISTLRSVYDGVPVKVRENLEAFYFLHPGFQSRLFLATFGRILFTSGMYGKVKYVKRLEFLWDDVRRKGIEMPEFVNEFDEELECRSTTMDYGLESDHPGIGDRHDFSGLDSAVSTYSMRCIG